MTLSSVELWQRVAACQLASPLQCRSWAAEVAGVLPAADTNNGEKVLAQLVTSGKLSAYQASVVSSDRPTPLVRGGWRILEPVNDPIWKDWWVASKTAQSSPSWVRWLTAEELQTPAIRNSGASLPNALRNSQIQGPHLQRVFAPEMQEGSLQMGVEPLRGSTLSGAVSKSGLPFEIAIEIVRQVALGLEPLHAAKMAHGRVTLDRIWLDEDRTCTLARDPLCRQVLSLDPLMTGLLGSQFPKSLGPAHFLAPEFLAPAQSATISTDLYSLGCVWWMLVTGQTPFQGGDATQVLTNQAEKPLNMAALNGQPAPFNRILEHLLSKNPTSRFQSATQLLKSLLEAQQIVRTGRKAAPAAATAETTKVKPSRWVEPSTGAVTDSHAGEAGSHVVTATSTPTISSTESTTTRPSSADQSSTPTSPAPTTSPASPRNTASPAGTATSKQVPPANAPPAATTTSSPAPKATPSKASDTQNKSALPTSAKGTATSKPTSNQTKTPSSSSNFVEAIIAESKPVETTPSSSKPPAPPTQPVPGQPIPGQPVSKSSTSAKSPLTQPGPASRSAPGQGNPNPSGPTNLNPANARELGTIPAAPAIAPAPPAVEPTKPILPAVVPVLETEAESMHPQAPAAKSQSESTPPSAIGSKQSKPATRPKSGRPTSIGGATKSGTKRKPARRQQANKWMLPMIGGGGVVAVILFALVMSGALQPAPKKPTDNNSGSLADKREVTPIPDSKPRDPRQEVFDLLSSDKKDLLWAPPKAPTPLALDMLPPGSQLFLSLRPASAFQDPTTKQLVALFDKELETFWNWIRLETGQSLESLEQVTFAGYPGKEGVPQWCMRVKLGTAKPLSELKTAWHNASEAKLGEQTLLVDEQRAYYVLQQPLSSAQSVSEFSVGPVELIKETAELSGAAAPLLSQMENLWRWSDSKASLCLLVAPNFLYTEGRGIVQNAPSRFASQFEQIIGRDLRGAMFLSYLQEDWFYELRVVGASDRDAPTLGQKLKGQLDSAPEAVEKWLVTESPHVYWRALAQRYPNMLRTLASQSRFGIEGGQSIVNGYLPSVAAPNLLLTSWIAGQPAATLIGDTAATSTTATPASKPLTHEEILDRPIKIVIDQQGIEIVLQAIGEAANEGLPSGTPALKFELDGAAFQRGGITRNQQIRDFKIENLPVRAALTELARRGNPEPGIKDMTEDAQKLLWVLMEDPMKPGEKLISLTSRDAANEKKIALPREFAPKP